MIKREARIVSNAIDFDALAARHVDRVLENSRRCLLTDPSQLECMPVKVNRVIVATPIVQHDSIVLPLLDYQRINIRPGFAIYGLAIKDAATTENFFKCQSDALIRFRMASARAEKRIVPAARLRLRPLRRTVLSRVFNDHA